MRPPPNGLLFEALRICGHEAGDGADGLAVAVNIGQYARFDPQEFAQFRRFLKRIVEDGDD